MVLNPYICHMNKYIYLFVALIVLSCGSPADSLQDLDLMKEGIPLKIKAPADAVVKQKDMGIFKDITIKEGDNFYIQITAARVLNSDVTARIQEEINSVKELDVFSKVIKNDERGFIFEKKKDDKLTYDFRSIKIVGNDEYLFQSGLIGTFSLEDVELMYDAVK